MNNIKVGLIGLGRMGIKHLMEFEKSPLWDVVAMCDVDPSRADDALKISPNATFTTHEDEIFENHEIQAVCLCALADSRVEQIKKAFAHGKHVMAEKPIAYALEQERELVQLEQASGLMCTVNLYLRNSWYVKEMCNFVASGEIGELAIIRVCHMTPGLSPGEGHEYEGPSFHDCGMHYCDIARMIAGSEFATGHAQAVRMWDYKDPWWLQCHGTFNNGVVFDITQGHVYGQLSAVQTHNSYIELVGTKGVVRMTHDFKTAVVEEHGVTVTKRIERPYGDKNIDVMCQRMAESIISGTRDSRLPKFQDAMIASEFAWRMLDDARKNALPSIGDSHTLDLIHERRASMTNGYGLIKTKKTKK